MKISTLLYTIKQGFANIFRNKWYSLASIATISACLFLFGLFYSIVANFQNILKTAEEGVSVTVFFHSEWDGCESHIDGQIPSEQRIEEIGQEIAKRAEVSDVQFKSADEAWATFGPDYFGEDYAEGFPENPLAGEDSYEIFLSDVSMQDALVTGGAQGQLLRDDRQYFKWFESADRLRIHGYYRDPAGCQHFPDQQYSSHRYLCEIGRDQYYEIYRCNGLFRACAFRVGRYADRTDRSCGTFGIDLFPV